MSKKRYKALGLMSGTSLDGVDAAIIDTDGEIVFGFGETYFRAYTSEERDVLVDTMRAAVKWNFQGTPPNIFARAEAIIHAAHIEAAQTLMSDDVDLIGFHGQTVLHRPPTPEQKGQTLQLGDGQVLADALGVDVVYDFRTADVMVGGQGAPLVPIYHKALLKALAIQLPAAVLNIGGVSNITILTADDELLASDCGPGNGPLDEWCMGNTVDMMDVGGKYSLKGNPNFAAIDKWFQADFFKQSLPRSADRYDFDVQGDLENCYDEPIDYAVKYDDCAATLSAFMTISVKNTLREFGKPIASFIVCGGGRHNKAMLWMLKASLGDDIVKTAEQVGWRGDDLEAEAFAYLAVRSVKGLPLSFPGTTGVSKPMCGGILAKSNSSQYSC